MNKFLNRHFQFPICLDHSLHFWGVFLHTNMQSVILLRAAPRLRSKQHWCLQNGNTRPCSVARWILRKRDLTPPSVTQQSLCCFWSSTQGPFRLSWKVNISLWRGHSGKQTLPRGNIFCFTIIKANGRTQKLVFFPADHWQKWPTEGNFVVVLMSLVWAWVECKGQHTLTNVKMSWLYLLRQYFSKCIQVLT